jgi:hypothetical protein
MINPSLTKKKETRKEGRKEGRKSKLGLQILWVIFLTPSPE